MPPAPPHRTPRLLPLALALFAAGCAVPGQPAGPAACEVHPQAVLPMELRNGEVIIPARIADMPVSLILDTGSEGAVLTERGAARLNLPVDPNGTTTLIGTSGTVRASRVLMQGLEVGGNEFPPQIVPVASLARQGEDDRPADGLVGAEILSFFDVDLDFPHRQITLYDVQNCSGRFLPWANPYTAIKLRRTEGNLLVLPVMLDGHPLTALFDTGANGGRLNRSAALATGLTAEAMALDMRGTERGVGGMPVPSSVHRFADLRIGTEEFHNVDLRIAERSVVQADMLLGLPYMVTRHIWLSYATNQMFVERRLGP